MTTPPSDTASSLPRPPALRSAVPPFIVMDVISAAARREAEGASVIHMEVGQPGTPAPRVVREAVKRLIDANTLGYTEGLGRPALRERIAQHYQERYGVSVAPERVIVTTGSSAAFVLAFLALFDAGERVILPSPGYPCYRHILSALGVESLIVETGPAQRWMPTAEQIDRAVLAQRRTIPKGQLTAADVEWVGQRGVAGMLVASPSNPTGTMLEPDRLKTLVETCRGWGMWFISDEIYHGLTYAMPAATALAYGDDAIVINSFSKYFSMTGWRIGWMVVPPGLVRTIERLAQNLYICAPAIAQAAALAAFDATEELEANRAVYRANRDLLLAELPKAGLTEIVPADGAFYLYVDVSRFTDDSRAFTQALLEETGIAATPGVDFDEARGGRFVRFSYSGTAQDMAEAARRLREWSGLRPKS
jgi:aspartate/methionine/tyrosine aminotransferase